MPGQTEAQQVGNVQLAYFANPGGLNSIGKNLFLATGSSGDPIVGTPGGSEGLGSLQQGMLEQSNVNVVDEFIQMILAQRSYEANSRVVRASDEMFRTDEQHEPLMMLRKVLLEMFVIGAMLPIGIRAQESASRVKVQRLLAEVGCPTPLSITLPGRSMAGTINEVFRSVRNRGNVDDPFALQTA